jgi:TRAP transporter TAXI family solute receptor
MVFRCFAKLRSVFACAAVVATAFIQCTGAAAQKATITMGATNATSSNYALAVAMSKAIKQNLPNANVTVVETGASVDNIRRMVKGEIDFGLTMVDTNVQATSGTGPFKDKAVTDIGVLYVYDLVVLNVAVRADAGINTLADLKGKKFSAGIRGSGAELLSHEIFTALGVQPEWVPGSLKDAVEGIQNRQLVGYSKYGVGTGLDATMRELLTKTPMKFVSFSEDQKTAVLGKVKGVDFMTIPANVIPDHPAALAPVVPATYSARSTLDNATAFAIAKAIYDNRQFLIDVFPHLKDHDFKKQTLNAEKLGNKLHPGAKNFWESVN